MWNEDRVFSLPRQELSSVGGGVRAAYGDRFRLDMLIAAPLDRAPFADPPRRPAPADLVHHPAVAMEVQMMPAPRT